MAHLAVAFPCRWCAGGMALAWRSSRPAAEKACAKGIPIRKSDRDAARMSRNRKGLRAVLREITQSADRSSLFWWMVKHHDELKTTASGRRLQWAALCTRFAELSLTDINGKPASPRTARETWLRVRRAVEEANRRLAAKPPSRVGAVYPSRIPRNGGPRLCHQSPRRQHAPGYQRPWRSQGCRRARQRWTPRSPKRKKPASKPRSTRCASSFTRRTGTSIRFHPQRGEQTNA